MRLGVAVESSIAIISLVKRLHLSARAAIDDALAPFGVSAAQYSVLRRLQDELELTGAELARQLFVTAQTMSRTLNGLEQAGLVERVARIDNPNATQNRLTPTGKETVGACRAVVQGITDIVVTPLAREERARFTDALTRCTEAAERLAGAAPEEAELIARS
jgi:DNA-binding MarR family transcriptional regulator